MPCLTTQCCRRIINVLLSQRTVMEQAMIDAAEIWNTAQVAEYLRTPATTIRWWRYIGQGPKSFKLGARKVAYLRSDVEAWLQQQYAA